MRKHLLLSFGSLLLTFCLRSQINFQKTCGVGFGQSVYQTNDKGYIVVGLTNGNNGVITLNKLDSLGVQQWSESFASGTDELRGYSVSQTKDGGYIITGNIIYYSLSNEDVILLKTNSSGVLQWKKYFSFGTVDYGFSVQQTYDGGFILTGRTDADIVMVKTDSNGNKIWSETINSSYTQQGKCVQQTKDSGYVVAGFLYNGNNFDVYLFKTDSSGALKWTKTFGGANDDFGYSVTQTFDGGYIVAGTTKSYGMGFGDAYIIKTDPNGVMQWTKTYGGISSDEAYSIKQTSDGGFIICGYTQSYGAGNRDVYLVKTDQNGNQRWTKTFGDTGDEEGNSVMQTKDGGFVMTGYINPISSPNAKIYIIKSDSLPLSSCYESYTVSSVGSGGVSTSGGTATIGGTTGNQFVQTNFGTSLNTICTNVDVNEISYENEVTVFPNPASSVTTLKFHKTILSGNLIIYNSQGKEIRNTKHITGKEISIQCNDLSDGLYFITITQNNAIPLTARFILTH
jgi:hypothetical protein